MAYITRQGNAFKLYDAGADDDLGTVRRLAHRHQRRREARASRRTASLLVYASTRRQGRDVLMTTTLDGKIKTQTRVEQQR